MRNHLLSLRRVGLAVALVIAFVGTLVTPHARADEWDKKTTLTFSEPIQVPGAVLPAGTYVFKLLDSESDRNIVEIFNADETRLMATVMAIPDERATPSDKTIVTFDERPSGQPEALQTWFYPGDTSGLEFVYPKQKATELAQVNRRPVPSVPDEVSEPTALKAAAVTRVSAPAPVTSAPPSDQPSTTVVEVEEQLPQTASPLPSIALAGLFCFAAAAMVRRRLCAVTK